MAHVSPKCCSAPLTLRLAHELRPIKFKNSVCLRASTTQPHFLNFALLIAFVQMEMERFELLTPCLQGRCSPN